MMESIDSDKSETAAGRMCASRAHMISTGLTTGALKSVFRVIPTRASDLDPTRVALVALRPAPLAGRAVATTATAMAAEEYVRVS